MGEISQTRPVLLVMAAISRHESALAWAQQQATGAWGAVALRSGPFEFEETRYYEASMGSGLRKVFWAFEQLIDPAGISATKRQTNDWEAAYASLQRHPQPRPLNLDPGYMTEAKLVLATTKDRDHRIYLNGGIYAEVTVFFRGGQWRGREWTYPDYLRDDYHKFFSRCREYLRSRYRSGEI